MDRIRIGYIYTLSLKRGLRLRTTKNRSIDGDYCRKAKARLRFWTLASSRQFRDSIGQPQANMNPIRSQHETSQGILKPRVTNASPTSAQHVGVGSSPTGGALKNPMKQGLLKTHPKKSRQMHGECWKRVGNLTPQVLWSCGNENCQPQTYRDSVFHTFSSKGFLKWPISAGSASGRSISNSASPDTNFNVLFAPRTNEKPFASRHSSSRPSSI